MHRNSQQPGPNLWMRQLPRMNPNKMCRLKSLTRIKIRRPTLNKIERLTFTRQLRQWQATRRVVPSHNNNNNRSRRRPRSGQTEHPRHRRLVPKIPNNRQLPERANRLHTIKMPLQAPVEHRHREALDVVALLTMTANTGANRTIKLDITPK